MTGKISIFTGSDEGLVAEKSYKHFNTVSANDDEGLTDDIIDGTVANAEGAYEATLRAIESLQTMSFFGGNKVVWLRQANFFGSDRIGESERAKEAQNLLLEVLEGGLADEVSFIISAPLLDKRRALYKFLKTNADFFEFNKVDTTRDGWEGLVSKIVDQESKNKGLSFKSNALDLFISRTGEDTRQIKSEIEKLDTYLGKGRKTVTLEDVYKMVPISHSGIVFEIGRSLQRLQATQVLRLIDRQLEVGASAIEIIRASIIPTVRNLFFAKILAKTFAIKARNYNGFQSAVQSLPENETSWLPRKKDGGVSLYPIFLSLRDSERFTLEGLKQSMKACLETDLMLVSRGLESRMLLHKLIAEIMSKSKGG